MILIITGAPGAGKGTIAEIIEQDLGLVHISTGDMLRQHIEDNDDIGVRVKSFLDKGELVPDSLVEEMVKFRLLKSDVKENGVLLDGFPRTIDQTEFLLDITAVDGIIEVFLEDASIIDRLSNRRVCPNCGASYHLITKKPKVDGVCDVCSHALIHRDDDTQSVIRDRLDTYHKHTAPIIDLLKDRGVSYLQLRGDLDIASQRSSIVDKVKGME